VPVNLLGDFAGGSMFLVAGVLAALLERERSGQGQVIDASIVDGTASLTAFVHGVCAAGIWRDERGVNPLDTGAPYYDVYQTSDGEWMAVGAIEPAFFAELIRLLGIEDAPPQHDRSRWPELRAALARRFAERTREEWADVFAASDACVAPVLSFAEAAGHPQLTDRETLVTRDGVLQPAPAPRFSRTPGRISREPPAPGAHSREVFESWGIPGTGEWLRRGGLVEPLTWLPSVEAGPDLAHKQVEVLGDQRIRHAADPAPEQQVLDGQARRDRGQLRPGLPGVEHLEAACRARGPELATQLIDR
jgi:alpha-methylacyl-CoA racemase